MLEQQNEIQPIKLGAEIIIGQLDILELHASKLSVDDYATDKVRKELLSSISLNIDTMPIEILMNVTESGAYRYRGYIYMLDMNTIKQINDKLNAKELQLQKLARELQRDRDALDAQIKELGLNEI